MDYDFRNRTAPPRDVQYPMYRQPSAASPSPSPHSMYGPSPYPRDSQVGQTLVPPASRQSFQHHTAPPSSQAPSLGSWVRVALKPEYRITPPPHLSPLARDIPRSDFQFDFELERRILAEAEKENQNWSKFGLENLPSKTPELEASIASAMDPVVSKYIASGLNREAVPIAVSNYGDNPTKVREFANAFTLLREMGFASSNVAEALLMYDNDADKASAHFLNSSS